jgi:hypothetical protein
MKRTNKMFKALLGGGSPFSSESSQRDLGSEQGPARKVSIQTWGASLGSEIVLLTLARRGAAAFALQHQLG